jgi:group II intron reverse transcriptase/maturase
MTDLWGREPVLKFGNRTVRQTEANITKEVIGMVEYKAKDHSVLQSEIAELATRWKDMRFMRLYDLLWKREWLEEALSAVLSNKGSVTAGVDGKTKESLLDDTGEKRVKFLDDLQRELKTRNYHPFPVLRKYIPKRKKGELRPIGIPTLKDRVVQMLLKMVLEPIFECDFLCNSNGFRLGRSTLECVLPLYQYGNMHFNYNYVIEGDIERCFDNIDHETLMKTVQKRIGDKCVLRLIWRFLKAPVRELKILSKTEKGTPQGGVLSPLLANIYLNEFDHYWLEQWGSFTGYQRQQRLKHGQANCVLFRYADDFILSAKGTKEAVESIMKNITQYFAEQLKLNLSTDKTRIVSIDEGFKFLGFQISREQLSGHKCIRMRPTQENVIRLKVKLQSMLGKEADKDDPQVKIAEISQVFKGWSGYFYRVNSYKQFLALDYYAKQLFLQWYCRKHKAGIYRALAAITVNNQIAVRRAGKVKPLWQMSDQPSQHTAKKYWECWKYRNIENPYLTVKGNLMTNAETEPEDPMTEADAIQDIHPIHKAYGEVYLKNRIKAFRRDGWRCRTCGQKSKQLEAHHVKPVPRYGKYDIQAVHSVDNLMTMCANCHRHLLLGTN